MSYSHIPSTPMLLGAQIILCALLICQSSAYAINSNSGLLDSLSAEASATDINPDQSLQTLSAEEPSIEPGDDHNVTAIVNKISQQLSELPNKNDEQAIKNALSDIQEIKNIQLDIEAIVEEAMDSKTQGDDANFADIVAEAMLGATRLTDSESSELNAEVAELKMEACALDLAMQKAVTSANLDYISECIKKGMNVNSHESDTGHTLLHLAAQEGQVSVTELLLKNGGDINSVDNERRTPLFAAVANNHVDMVNLLIQQGANPEMRDRLGGQPLSRAVRTDIRKLLRNLENAVNAPTD